MPAVAGQVDQTFALAEFVAAPNFYAIDQLIEEVAAAGLSVAYEKRSADFASVTLSFVAAISAGDATALDAVVAAHTGVGVAQIDEAQSALLSQQFGCYMNAVPLNFRKGSGASTDAGTTEVSQLTAWVRPEASTLRYIEIESFRTSFTTDPVIGFFIGSDVTPVASVTMDAPILLPDTGSYQVIAIPGDIEIPANSVVTVRQTAGQTLEFSSGVAYFE